MPAKRIKSMKLICFICIALLCVRLLYISVYRGESLETMAKAQQNKKTLIEYKRGDIYSRNKIPFTNTGTKNVYLTDTGGVSGIKSDAVYTFTLKERGPTKAKHLIGYTDMQNKAVCGIEKAYDDYLKTDSAIYACYMADAHGTPAGDYSLKEDTLSAPGTINLTLDYNIQSICENVMDTHIKKGAAVLLDVKSFDVLASVSRPSYDDKNIDKYLESTNGELLNRVLMPYNAGSVFKIVTVSAALEKNMLHEKRSFNCLGSFCPDKLHRFYCNNRQGHGMLTMENAFAKSCNCAFYALATDIGASAIIDKAADFGIGSTLLNSPLGESRGNLPIRSFYSPAEAMNICIGQGEILITPLQCAVISAVIASGGIRKDVNIVDSFGAKSPIDARNKGTMRVVSEKTAATISQMMRKCVTEGTGLYASKSNVSVAGKTGSAETGMVENGENLVHGWFCGFFPYENPQYALALFSEGGKSGSSCVEPFVKIAEEINKIYPFKQ